MAVRTWQGHARNKVEKEGGMDQEHECSHYCRIHHHRRRHLRLSDLVPPATTPTPTPADDAAGVDAVLKL